MTDTIPVPLLIERAPGPPGPRPAGPCTLVILGATGDLTRSKLIPALLHLAGDDLLPEAIVILGVGRQGLSSEQYRAAMRRQAEPEPALWKRFAAQLEYQSADLDQPDSYSRIAARLDEIEARDGRERGRLFYLALPPSVYPETVQGLSRSGAMPRRDPEDPRWVRAVIEKPFGRSEASARKLNRILRGAIGEHQIYRIDHFLGKETVQNLLVFRFANAIFEPVWNRDHIHHVQIIASETGGIGTRAAFYEEAGVVRDMFQNHLLSLLSLVAMEPPGSFTAEAARDEKAKVLNAIRPLTREAVSPCAIRGQYGRGRAGGKEVPGYREENGVAPDSTVETFAAIRFLIDNWRWEGVPFLLRSGKRLARQATEIAIRFRRPPHLIFPAPNPETFAPNALIFRLQPNEGLSLSFELKVPGTGLRTTAARMDFAYAEGFGPVEHDAYETLLLDCIAGDPMLFLRSDAVEAAWRAVDPIRAAWDAEPPEDFPNYPAGSWGPPAAQRLMDGVGAGACWREP
ncbi:MAG: glucose-6-phosphate dehydrogenase [Gemmatimonadales bacterium]